MCAIFGRIALSNQRHLTPPSSVLREGQERGRDSWGIAMCGGKALRHIGDDLSSYTSQPYTSWVIGNTRAEPTTEWVGIKDASRDVQPFTTGPLTIAHNGTFANDRQLCEQVGIDPDTYGGSKIDTARWAAVAAREVETPEDVLNLLSRTVGSYGIAVGHEDGWVVLAANYRPIWVRFLGTHEIEFTSIAPRRHPFLTRLQSAWQMLDPYSALIVHEDYTISHRSLRPSSSSSSSSSAPTRSLVVCSGGMDSTVAATRLVARGDDVDLLHVTYGARAQDREMQAVRDIAQHLGTRLRVLDLTEVFAAIGNSRLTGTWEGAASGEAGAEYASEWVPARNTILLAAALGIAEGHGYDVLALGNNLEEAGAYPDNEQEFIGRFNDLLPFAVADGTDLSIQEPVGNLTKSEIVAMGIDLDAPLHLTWSCYDGGQLHCGDCGPCFMRATAYAMVGEADPMRYQKELS